MLTLGIIGTSPITHQFIDAAHSSKHYQLRAVYSRSLDKAQDFAKSYVDVDTYADWQDFLAADLDIIYIASPNALHFEQAKAVLEAGKHAIVEKPMVSRPEEFIQLQDLAQEKGLFLFEAARNYHEKAFETIRDFLAGQTILGGYFGYAKYSSKMAELLAGQEPNIFSAKFSGGAIMDLGVYTLYAAIRLLGHPKTAYYKASQLENTVDLNGTGQLIYDDFVVTIQAGKNITSNLPSEIYTSTGTLTLNSCQHIQSAIFTGHDGNRIELPISPVKNNMLEEALQFSHIIKNKDTATANKWLEDTQAVHQTIFTMRKDAGIVFDADCDQ
ncbi:TPA: Gfo/Idh/MocA family protein [Streptococcus suis]